MIIYSKSIEKLWKADEYVRVDIEERLAYKTKLRVEK